MLSEKLVRALIKNRSIVIIFTLIVTVAGLYSYYMIPKRENPDTTVAAAVITTVYPGASPEEVEYSVTEVIEREIALLSDVDYYTGMSMNSASVITVMYDMEVTTLDISTDLMQAVARAASNLPELAEESVVNTDVVSYNQFIISLSGEGYTDSELSDFAENVKDIIVDVEGIESVTVDGMQPRQVVVETRAEDMRSYGLSTETILQIMQAQNLSIPTGSIDYDSGTINVVTPTVFESLRDIENIVVGGSADSLSFIKLRDVADVYLEDEGDFFYMQDGQNAILLTGTIAEGENAVLVGDELRLAIDAAKSIVPPDVNFHEVMYAPEDIENSVNGFIINLIQSILLIVLVVMIGVRLRNGLIVSIALPVSILSTFIVMYILGVEFQFISIAALIVSLGILVDNAIVISEEIQQNLNMGTEKVEAICAAVRSTAVPVLSSTLTTVVTFSIIYFVPGVVGQVAGAIPTVVITALVASYIVAMCLIPVLAYFFFKPESEKRVSKESLSKRAFSKMLDFSLKYRKTVVFGSFLTLAIAAALAMTLGLKFFPVANKPILYINYETESMSLDASALSAECIAEMLDTHPMVENYTYAVGKGLPSFFLTVPTLTTAPNVGQFMLSLDEQQMEIRGGPEASARELQALLDESLAGASATVRCLEYSMPTEASITYSVSGEDIDKIYEVADAMVETLLGIEGTDRVRDTRIAPQYEYQIETDSELLSSYGLLRYDVAKQVNTALMGADAGVYRAGGTDMDIVLRSDVQSLTELEALQIVGSVSGTKLLLGQVATIGISPSVPLIEHYNGERYINVLSNVLPGYSSLSIEAELEALCLSQIDLEGVSITSGGEVSNMMDLIGALGVSALIAVLIIYLILMLQFKDFRKPLIILSSIPLSFIGCGLGLRIFNMDIQAMALLGLVSLFGIVVNTSILLIEATDEARRGGLSVNEACKAAVSKRYRPIMLSSVTTCIGLVPLVLSGDSMTAPMASVLLFGLLFSTLLTMVVVPTLYAMQMSKRESATDIAAKPN